MESGRFVIAFAEGVTHAEKAAILNRHIGPGAWRFLRTSPRFDVLAVAGSEGMPPAVLAELHQDPRVRMAEEDGRVYADSIRPDDPLFWMQWALHNTGQGSCSPYETRCSKPGADISALRAWEETTGSSSVVVAVIDTGVDDSHPDLAANILRDDAGKVIGYDFVHQDEGPEDDNGHGTQVAGIIGAVGNNGTGIAGVAWNVSIMPLKALGASGAGWISDFAAAIDFAVQHGAHIINISAGSQTRSPLLFEAVRRAEEKGVLIVASAGNLESNLDRIPYYPASHARDAGNVMAIAATDSWDGFWRISSFGPGTCDLAAPAFLIPTLAPRACPECEPGGYTWIWGTSAAAAMTSGAAALVKSLYPAADARQIRARLTFSADRFPEMEGYTRSGRLNAWRALQPDGAPPGPPRDLMVLGVSPTSIRLRWKAPGDDGDQGTVSSYVISWSPMPDLAAASRMETRFAPAAAGDWETYDLGHLNPLATYHVAVQAMDKAGRLSEPAMAGPVATARPALFDGAEEVPLLGPSYGRPWEVVTEGCRSGRRCYATPAGVRKEFFSMLTKDLVAITGPAFLTVWWRQAPGSGPAQFSVNVQSEQGYHTTGFLAGLSGPQEWTSFKVDLTRFVGQKVRLGFDGVILDSADSSPGTRLMVDDFMVVFLKPGTVDDVEGEPRFIGLPWWSITTEDHASPSHSWSDSPGTNCANNARMPLMQTRSFTVPENVASWHLVFQAKVDLEYDRDFLSVYASADGGENWNYLGAITGTGGWRYFAFPLDTGWREVRALFLLSTNEAVCLDGVHLDDIGVWGEPLSSPAGAAPGGSPGEAAASSRQPGERRADTSATELRP